MHNSCVVVCAGHQARLYTLEAAEFPELESGPNLVSRAHVSGEESAGIFSELKTGRNRAPNGASHGYDDHRDKHIEELERRFAHDVAERTRHLINQYGIHKVVLVAHDHCLSALRHAFQGQFRNGTELHEVAKDLSKLKAHEIHAHLARDRLLPERSGPQRAAS
jgi:protein required for attachment to host cells